MATINLQVRVDAAAPLLMLKNGGRRAGFAIVNALNQTGESVQIAVRGQVFSDFQVRKPAFIISQVKLFKASVSRGRFEARVGIGIGKAPQGSPLLLPGFESGAERRPAKGSSVAVPITGGARPSKPQSIPETLWVQRLQLRRVRSAGKRKAGSEVVRKGLQRTFQIPGVGILQRVGKQAVKLLYAFKRPFRLDRRLRFHETARRIVDREFARNLRTAVFKEFTESLRRR